MLSLKFPSLEKLLGKNTGELEDDDPKRGVCVKNGHAIIVMEQAMVFFDLEDYFIKENNFINQKELDDLRSVLDFMDGKMFSAFFWKELTSLNAVGVTEEGLNLDGVIKKDIFYKEQLFDYTEIRMLSKSLIKSEPFSKHTGNIYMEPLLKIFTDLKSLIKDDIIFFRTVGMNTQVQFTFDENPWIYGVISVAPSINEKQFMFDSLIDFAKEIG